MRTLKTFAAALAVFAGAVPTGLSMVHAQDQVADDEARKNAAAKVIQRSLDKARAYDFEGWLSTYSPDALVIVTGMQLVGRDEIAAVYKPIFDMKLKSPTILESGWTGDRIYILQLEYFPDGSTVETYAEYEVRDGKIVAVYGTF